MRWLLLSVGVSCGCGLFSPRAPQAPEGGEDQGYRQPLTPEAIVENMQTAIARRDVVLYLSCLVDSAVASGRPYRFEPSGRARSQYSWLFARWDREAERRSFVAFAGKIPEGFVPELLLIAPVFELRTPDSVLLRAEYQLSVPHREPGIATVFRGSLRWTMIPQQNGSWAILRWSDSDAPDTAAMSWSILKAVWSQ